ncbi:MAG: GIY-YIG nuclease family protein [Aerococcus sp.]|nr:GIY-YIG nuclease family protein [Aerococcus sp.]
MAKTTHNYYMYVLACADGTLYTGYTTDLKQREQAHQSKKGAKYTKPARRHPVKMIFSVAFQTKHEALVAEYHFKQHTRKEKEALLKAHGVVDFTPQAPGRIDITSADWLEQQEEEA